MSLDLKFLGKPRIRNTKVSEILKTRLLRIAAIKQDLQQFSVRILASISAPWKKDK